MLFLSVAYHYIDDENKYPLGGIYPVSPDRLENQIKLLDTFFSFISQQDLVRAITEGAKLPENCCLITFDDGLSCQYEKALPVLEKLGIPAIFFSNSAPYVNNKVLSVHKIHHLRSIIPSPEFYGLIRETIATKLGKDVEQLMIVDQKVSDYRYDDEKTNFIKYLLNKALSDSEREVVIDDLFSRYVDDEKKFAEKLYFSIPVLRDLSQKGYLGAHTFSHKSLASLTDAVLEKEITDGKTILENITGNKILGVSYPYGSKRDVDLRVASSCKRANLKFGFSFERAFNGEPSENPFCLARADTNDVPGGKSPAFIINDGSVKIVGDFLMKPSLFLGKLTS